ncbi:redoxin domain-containing protein [Parapedobacter deserti]|uniref:Redoxin domain-containing protein n=1 Tax=Parapedobacter deserti TaxID=1912957 RepID=A0ABV7JKV4_9SPHI
MNWQSIAFITTAVMGLTQVPATAQTSQQPFELKGKVSTTDTSATAYLIYGIRTEPVTDSVHLVDGTFRFTGHLPGEEKAYLLVNHGGHGKGTRDMLEFFVSPGRQELPEVDSVIHIRFEPGTTNGDFQQLQGRLQPLSMTLRQVSAALKQIPGDSALAARRDSLVAARRETYRRFAQEHPGSIASVEALHQYAGPMPDASMLEPLYRSLALHVRQSYPGQVLGAQLVQAKQTSEGQPAPDFTQPTPDGKDVHLADFRGGYVLVDFWASWCKPCRVENPHLVAAYRQFKDRGFTILGVSLDSETGRQAWLKAIADDGLEWTQVSDLQGWKNKAAQLYGVKAIPQNFLIDPSGKIVARDLRGDALHEKLQQLFE